MLLNVFNFFYSRNIVLYFVWDAHELGWILRSVYRNALHRKCRSYTQQTGVTLESSRGIALMDTAMVWGVFQTAMRQNEKKRIFECFGMETYLRLLHGEGLQILHLLPPFLPSFFLAPLSPPSPPGLLDLLHSLPYRQLWMQWSGPGPERMPERMPKWMPEKMLNRKSECAK